MRLSASEAKTDVLAFTAFRADVGEIFPNLAIFPRLAIAAVIEAHDEWQVTGRHLSDISMAGHRNVIAAITEPRARATPNLLAPNMIR